MGRSASAKQGQWRKLRGVKAGIPDVLIVHASKTLWLEIKDGSALSEAQKTTRDALRANGHLWCMCSSMESVQEALVWAQIPLRATLGDIRARIAEQDERLAAKPKRASRPRSAPRYSGAGMQKRAAKRGIMI